MNAWPGGVRRALSQKEHEQWNAHEYPGTRQLCSICNEPTDRCEDDTLWVDDQPVCEACWQEQEG